MLKRIIGIFATIGILAVSVFAVLYRPEPDAGERKRPDAAIQPQEEALPVASADTLVGARFDGVPQPALGTTELEQDSLTVL